MVSILGYTVRVTPIHTGRLDATYSGRRETSGTMLRQRHARKGQTPMPCMQGRQGITNTAFFANALIYNGRQACKACLRNLTAGHF